MKSKRYAQIFRYTLLLIYAAICLFPVYWLVSTSFKPPIELFSLKPQWLFKPTIVNYKTVLFNDTFPLTLLNSGIISLITVLITLPIGSLAGYAFARFNFKGKENYFFLALTTRMAPPAAFGVPMFIMLFQLGLIDTHLGLILIYVFWNLSLCIWLSRSFFEEVPAELEESALLDGCSVWSAFLKITVPIAFRGLLATAVLMFIFSWNEFFFASILTRSTAETFPVHLTSFFGARRILWGELTAASSIGAVIPIIFALMFRRYLVRGLTLGTVK